MFIRWKKAFKSNSLKSQLAKTKVMVTEGITKECLYKIYPCGVCGLRVMANSVVCVQCGNWIHGRCARVKRVTAQLSRNYSCRKCEVTF